MPINSVNKSILSNWSSVTISATRQTTAFNLGQHLYYSVSIGWTTANASGTFTLEASNDPVPILDSALQTNVTNWDTVSNSTETVAGASGTFTWNFQQGAYQWFRVKYTSASGTGTINYCNMTLK